MEPHLTALSFMYPTLKGIIPIAQKEDPFLCNKSATNAHKQEKVRYYRRAKKSKEQTNKKEKGKKKLKKNTSLQRPRSDRG